MLPTKSQVIEWLLSKRKFDMAREIDLDENLNDNPRPSAVASCGHAVSYISDTDDQCYHPDHYMDARV